LQFDALAPPEHSLEEEAPEDGQAFSTVDPREAKAVWDQ